MNVRRQLTVWSLALLAVLVVLLVAGATVEGAGGVAAVVAVPVAGLLVWVTVLRARV